MTAVPRTEPALRVLLALAWPVVLARSTQSVIGFTDALMVARLGEDELAAVTAGSMNTFAAIILPMGMAFIVQSFAAQLAGRGDLDAARRYAWYGLGLAVAAQALALALIPAIAPILGTLAYAPAVAGAMATYLQIRMLGLGFAVGSEVIGNWYGGLGNTRLQLVASVVAMVVNVALNWVLIYGNLGAPALGVAGAAIASVLATAAGFATLLGVFAWGHGLRPLRLGLRGSEALRLLRFGLPNGINWFFEFAAFVVFVNVVVAELGTATVAALMVVININSVSFMPAFGLSSAGAILAGQSIGEGHREDVPRIVGLTLGVNLAWQGSVAVAYVAFPAALVGLFAPEGSDTSALVGVGTTMLALSAAWQLFDAVGIGLSEILRAAGDTAWTMWARLVLAWAVFVPAAYVGVVVLGYGHVSAMLALLLYLGLLALALALRFRSGAWRRIDLTGLDELPV
jgi:MATE family multidrug resistance protein